MDAGLMRHRIEIQALQGTPNVYGEIENVWVTMATVRASINPVSGREFMAANQEHAAVTHKVTIRYNRTVKASMRVLYGARVLDILHVIDTWEQHHEMVLLCKELI